MKKCRFNIPYPPMNETCILTPLTEDISNPITRKICILQYEKLLQYLRDFKDSDSSSNLTLEDILQKLSIKDVNEYKSIIRTVIRRPTVFLKRTIKQRMVSGFNEKLFPLWQSNMDIQFILDVYSCVRYVIEYIGKRQCGISKLMRDIVENFKSSTDLSVKEQLKKNSVNFFRESRNLCTGSSIHLLRTRMLKPMAVRGEMDPKSDDIFFDGLNEYYSCRPHSLEDVTLAEFGSNYEVCGKKNRFFNKVEETQLDDNEIQIEGEQGRNNNQLVDDEDWVPDDVLINDVGDYVENTNTSDVDSPKDGSKIIVHLIDYEQFKDLIGCLNDGQRQLLYHTTNVIRSQLWGKGHPAMKVFVTGPAGAGKSMLIRALAQSVIRIANLRPDIDDLSLPPVLLTAPTGKAAFGIKGLTLHSAFKLPLNQFAGLLPKLSSDISNTLRCKFANVKLLIIDEISMVGIKTLGYIDQRLRSILRINKPFGDINVIVFSVFFQLSLVLATPLYDSFEEILSKYPSAVEMLSIKSIWETFKFYELTEIMRQKDDKQFAIMLTKSARGQLEEADVKYFQNLITHLDITFQPQIMDLWATNYEVDEMNRRKQLNTGDSKHLNRRRHSERCNRRTHANKQWTDCRRKEVAKRVWIKFDEPDVGSLTRQKIKNKLKPEGEHTGDMCKWTPIEIIKLEFQLGNAEHHKVTRMQLLLVEALALTVHKSQCNNCNNIGSSEDKHQIIITDLKISGVLTSILEIAGAQYKTQAAILHMGENTSSGHYIA
ncbi:hypothetical protein AGLY_017175 [Aphis glycines]|uniref:ATP-dependent DNA helicase n=1 Tax=Aphis glycines TaxID=307491 RepID=A0A6G0SVL6_APHGL|nr:hypothetical protein AGLY_017175 [Aphis glycines]